MRRPGYVGRGRVWWGTTGMIMLFGCLLLSAPVGAAPAGVMMHQPATGGRAATSPADTCPPDTSLLITIPVTFSGLYPNAELVAGVRRDLQSASFSAGKGLTVTYVIVTTGTSGESYVDFRPHGVTVGEVRTANQQPITRLTFCTTPSIVQTCAATPLGPATDFNVFALGDLTQENATTGGRLAVGGRATLTNYSVGGALPSNQTAGDTLVVGGALTFQGGAVTRGNAVSGGPGDVANVSFAPGNGYRQGMPLDFAAAASTLRAASRAYAALPANGTTQVQYGTLTLTGADPKLNVFTVSGTDLSAANSLVVDIPARATVLVNITGTRVQMQNMGFSLNFTGPSNVLYNFPEATALRLENVGVQGSILAPMATVDLVNGEIAGTLVGAAVSGPGQATRAPFMGCLPQA